eukprot:5507230-Pleurochrysis_carterae.AAC.3
MAQSAYPPPPPPASSTARPPPDSARALAMYTRTYVPAYQCTHVLMCPRVHVPIYPGFVATTLAGTPTTLKRSGSDYSATIFARLMGASKASAPARAHARLSRK